MTPHPTKYQRIYFSKNGFSSSHAIGFKSTNSFCYLGHTINSHGMKQPSYNRFRAFLKECRDSINQNYSQSLHLSPNQQGHFICQQLEKDVLHFNLQKIQEIEHNANLMFRANKHHYLNKVDKMIALMIAEKISGISGIQAFRRISYKTIRNEWKLPSLLMMINNFYRK